MEEKNLINFFQKELGLTFYAHLILQLEMKGHGPKDVQEKKILSYYQPHLFILPEIASFNCRRLKGRRPF